MLSRSTLTFSFAAVLNISAHLPCHAAIVPADHERLATFTYFGVGDYSDTPSDGVRIEVGFAQSWTSTSTGPPLYLTAPLFSESRFTDDDDGTILLATKNHTPGFEAFADALIQRNAGTMKTRFILLNDGQPDRQTSRINLAAIGPDGWRLPNTFIPDLSAFEITHVELAINIINFELRTHTHPTLGEQEHIALRQQHEVRIYGHPKGQSPQAAPSPTAATAGLGLLAMALGRRYRRPA